jgi:hypothetical protein
MWGRTHSSVHLGIARQPLDSRRVLDLNGNAMAGDNRGEGIEWMRPDRNIKLPADLWSRINAISQAEGKSVDDLLEEAALRLLQVRELRSFVAENREMAEQRGLTEADVPRLISETRRGQ